MIFYEENPLDCCLFKACSIIDIIDGSLTKTPMEKTQLFIIYHTYWEIWNQRNDRIYNHKHQPSMLGNNGIGQGAYCCSSSVLFFLQKAMETQKSSGTYLALPTSTRFSIEGSPDNTDLRYVIFPTLSLEK